MAFHPTQAGLLLIAHDCGTLNEWDLSKESSVALYPAYQSPSTNLGGLTSVCWNPLGCEFGTGHRNGDVLIWKRGQLDGPVRSMIMSEHGNTPRRPIRRLIWTKLLGKDFLCTLGGTSMSHEADT
jgi:hypothetical protein